MLVHGSDLPVMMSKPERLFPVAECWQPVRRWKVEWKGTWAREEHINIQELRTVCLLMKHLSRTREAWDSKVLVMADSWVTISCIRKMRSKSRALLRLLRMISAVQFCTGARPIMRWIPSRFNPADGPSRGHPVGAAPETIEKFSKPSEAETMHLQGAMSPLENLPLAHHSITRACPDGDEILCGTQEGRAGLTNEDSKSGDDLVDWLLPRSFAPLAEYTKDSHL